MSKILEQYLVHNLTKGIFSTSDHKTNICKEIEGDVASIKAGTGKGKFYRHEMGEYHIGLHFWYEPLNVNGSNVAAVSDKDIAVEILEALRDEVWTGAFDGQISEISQRKNKERWENANRRKAA
jgi:hypothetical protein